MEYICSFCDIILPKFPKYKILSSSIPGIPGMYKPDIYYQVHENHTTFFEFSKGGKIIRQFSYPLIRDVFQTLIYDNASVYRIVNTISERKNKKTIFLNLMITDVDSYKDYFKALSQEIMHQGENLEVEYLSNSLKIGSSSIQMIIADLNQAIKILKSAKHRGKNTVLRSLVIDTSKHIEKDIVKKFKSARLKLLPHVRTIIAFNNRITKEPPLLFRDFMVDKYDIESVDLLNYQDTNGLKTIILQSFYNLLDDTLEARETFEIMTELNY